MKNFTAFVFFSLFLALSISAQTTAPLKTVSGGILNGKASSLAKPEYPAAARAVKAAGAVSVQVLIDENGNVESASAVSGHPLLRRAAEQAALESKFAPTMLSGQPVKVSGVITYNFVGASTTKMYMTNWLQTGMLLEAVNKAPTLRYVEPSVLAQMIPADWVAEREQIQRLDELKKTEAEAANGDAPKEIIIDERSVKNQNNSTPTRVTTTTVTISPDRKVSSESAAIAQSLIASIQGRLGSEPINLWYFNLGSSINQALDKADSRSKDERLTGVQSFRESIKSAPSEISKDLMDELQKMALVMEKGVFTNEDKIALSQSLMKINTISGN